MERSKSRNRTSKVVKTLALMIGLLTAFVAFADADLHLPGKVAIPSSLSVGKTSEADASAALDVVSTTKGSLLPRMTSTQRDAISSPATGLIVFNTTSGQYEFYTGSGWSAIGGLSGPGSSVDGDFALFNGTTGKLIKDAGSNLTWDGSAFGITGSYSVSSTTAASIPLPRMTNTQMNAITPLSEAFGVWNLNAHKPYFYNGSGWHETSFIDTVETLTNKTLTDPAINAVDFSEQSSTPTTPSAGTKKMYCKNDGVCYTLDSSGNEVPVGSGSGGFDNLLADQYPTFDSSVSAWTASGGTLASVTSGANFMGMGKSNATIDASAAGQTYDLPAITVPNGYANTNGLLRCKVWNQSGATYTMGAWNGTALTGAITIPSTTTPTYVEVMTPLGAAGTTETIRFTSVAANEPLISVKDCYIGQNFDVGTVAQAILIGQIKITGCAAAWTTTSSSLGVFSACSGGSYTVLSGSGVSAPSTNIPGIKFSNLPPGNYRLEYEGLAYVSGGNLGQLQFWDGTNTANELSQLGGGSTVTTIGESGIKQTISYSTAQSNITLSIRGSTAAGTESLFGTNGQPGVISVYYFPTQSQQAVRADTTPANWSGTSTLSGTTASTSGFADPGSVTGAITTTGTPHNITCVANASGKLGIDCTLPRTGNYQVCFSGFNNNSGSTNGIASQLVDGSGAVIVGKQSGANQTPMGSCGNYSASSTSVTFKIQGLVSAGTGTFNPFSFSVTSLDQGMPAPLLVGSVTSNTSGMERIERVAFGGSCSGDTPATQCTGTCVICSQSGSWITSIIRNSLGTYTFNIASGEFSGTPSCYAGLNPGSEPTNGGFENMSSTSFKMIGANIASTGAAIDSYGSVVCIGPR